MGFVKYRTVRLPVGQLGFSAERGATFALVHAVVNYKIDQISYNFNIGNVCVTLANVPFQDWMAMVIRTPAGKLNVRQRRANLASIGQ